MTLAHREALGRTVLGCIVLGCIVLGAGACDGSGPRIYTARAYSAEARCLESYAAIGSVEADELGASCDRVCLLLDDALHVSTVCPPYPAEAALTDPLTTPECGVALDLLEAGVFCDQAAESDAGTFGEPGPDGGLASDAGSE